MKECALNSSRYASCEKVRKKDYNKFINQKEKSLLTLRASHNKARNNMEQERRTERFITKPKDTKRTKENNIRKFIYE